MLARVKSLPIGMRIIGATVLVGGVVVGVNYAVFVQSYESRARDAMAERAAAFTAIADEAKNHVSRLYEDGAFDVEALRADLEKVQAAGRPYSESKVFQTLPIVTGWSTAEQAAAREGIEFSIKSFDARNEENEPAAGSFEEQLLKDLTAQVESGARTGFRVGTRRRTRCTTCGRCG